SRQERFSFVQPEDGIRDDLVTGVQTCALPICALDSARAMPCIRTKRSACLARALSKAQVRYCPESWTLRPIRRTIRENRPASARSEERRVGQECQSP